jgi:membrane-associated phospholipid phosphatase
MSTTPARQERAKRSQDERAESGMTSSAAKTGTGPSDLGRAAWAVGRGAWPRARWALDYNRRLVWPVRLAGAAWGAVLDVAEEIDRAPFRRGWVLPLLVGGVVFWVLLPWDGALSAWARGLGLRGDVLRELEAVQQFGQLTFSLLIAAAVALLDRARRRRLLDWAAAAIVALLVSNLLKMMIGRPRPLLNDPATFTGPLGLYPLPQKGGDWFVLASGWTSNYDLGACPSRHATMAAVAAVFLIVMYPRLRWLAVALAATVGVARVVTGAHWPTDVVAGLAIGTACALPAIRGYLGTRALDWFWRRAVNPQAQPAYPRLRAACGEGRADD